MNSVPEGSDGVPICLLALLRLTVNSTGSAAENRATFGRVEGAVEFLVRLLNSNDEATVELAAAALRSFAGDEMNAQKIIGANALPLLVCTYMHMSITTLSSTLDISL